MKVHYKLFEFNSLNLEKDFFFQFYHLFVSSSFTALFVNGYSKDCERYNPEQKEGRYLTQEWNGTERNMPEWGGITPEWNEMNKNGTGIYRNEPEWHWNEVEWHTNKAEYSGMKMPKFGVLVGANHQIFLMTEVLQMLQKAKTHAIPLGNHVTQQKLTETTENQSVLTRWDLKYSTTCM